MKVFIYEYRDLSVVWTNHLNRSCCEAVLFIPMPPSTTSNRVLRHPYFIRINLHFIDFCQVFFMFLFCFLTFLLVCASVRMSVCSAACCFWSALLPFLIYFIHILSSSPTPPSPFSLDIYLYLCVLLVYLFSCFLVDLIIGCKTKFSHFSTHAHVGDIYIIFLFWSGRSLFMSMLTFKTKALFIFDRKLNFII